MWKKTAIKYLSVHHNDGFMIGKRLKIKEVLLTSNLYLLFQILWPYSFMAFLFKKIGG